MILEFHSLFDFECVLSWIFRQVLVRIRWSKLFYTIRGHEGSDRVRLSVFRFLSFITETFSANWHVHLSSTNKLNFVANSCSKSKACIVTAIFANGGHFFDFLGQRDELHDQVKALSHVSAIKSRYQDDYTGISSCFTEVDNLLLINMCLILTSLKNWPSSIPITSYCL